MDSSASTQAPKSDETSSEPAAAAITTGKRKRNRWGSKATVSTESSEVKTAETTASSPNPTAATTSTSTATASVDLPVKKKSRWGRKETTTTDPSKPSGNSGALVLHPSAANNPNSPNNPTTAASVLQNALILAQHAQVAQSQQQLALKIEEIKKKALAAELNLTRTRSAGSRSL